MSDLAPSTSFGAVAASYRRSRPATPYSAVSWLTADTSGHALELGAGTGMFTRHLIEAGRFSKITAVEPDERMLHALSESCRGVQAVLGSAEQIPMDETSVDAVLVCSAWHWFDPSRAFAEISRVLRPQRTLGVVWNLRDTTQAWVAGLEDLLPAEHPHQPPGTFTVTEGIPFSEPVRHTYDWVWRVSLDRLVNSVATYSSVLTLPPSDRNTTLHRVRRYLKTAAPLDEHRLVPVPMRTVCYRTTHRADQ